jgi:ATP-dependent protease HslVU (ClpYQ) peptidase subunit
MALTTAPLPSSAALRNARHCLAPAPGHAALGDGRADLVGAAQAGARAGLAEAEIAAEALGVARQLLAPP